MKQEGGGEVRSGRVSAEHNLVLGDADRVDEVVVAGEGLDELRGVLVLGGEAVVEEEDRSADVVLLLELLDRVAEEDLGVRARVEARGDGRSLGEQSRLRS